MSEIKNADIYLGYFKPGDDFGSIKNHLSKNKDDSSNNINVEALRQHAQMLVESAQQLTYIADIVENCEMIDQVDIDGDCHCIFISGPTGLIDMLVEKDLVSTEIFDQLEEEYDDGDE